MSASGAEGEEAVANGVHGDAEDEDEVSLSDTSLTDDDSSGDEGYEDNGGLISDDSGNDCDHNNEGGNADDDGEEREDIFRIKGSMQSLDEFAPNTREKIRRFSSLPIAPAQNHHYHKHTTKDITKSEQEVTDKSTLPGFKYHDTSRRPQQKSLRKKGYLDDIPSHMDGKISMSLALSMARQHVQLAHSCLELLDEKDRQDALRRRTARRALLWNGGNSNEANYMIENDDADDDEEDDACPLLTMIKSGPLYKLHVKGGRKISSKMSKGKSDELGGSGRGRGVTQRLLTKWKPKFVEVRKGVFSYYNDSRKSSYSLPKSKKNNVDEGLVRKNIPLQALNCACRAVDYFGTGDKELVVPEDESAAADAAAHYAPPAKRLYAFELVVQGLPTRLFATGTEAGRKAWIRSICKGMVGFTDSSKNQTDCDVGDGGVDTQKNAQLQKFISLSQAAATAATATSYTESFARPLWDLTMSISVPIASIFNLISPLLTQGNTAIDQSKVTSEGRSQIQIEPQNEQEKFWNMLKRFNFRVLGQTLRGHSIHGPERVFGALMRGILECDKSSMVSNGEDAPHVNDGQELMTEIQAAQYARDVLKSTVGEHKGRAASLEMAVKALCNNRMDLVTIVDASDKSYQAKGYSSTQESTIINFNVIGLGYKRNDFTSEPKRSKIYDRREWLHVRTNKSNRPRRCFAVLSVGVLCFYREAHPRPHKLIGQLFLVGAKIGFWTKPDVDLISSYHTENSTGAFAKEEGSMISSNSNHSSDAPQSTLKRPNYILYVVSKEKKDERHLCFADYEQFSEWREALILAVQSCSSPLAACVTDSLSTDEVISDQQHPTSAQRSTSSALTTFNSPFRLPCAFETDSDGITWTLLATSAQEQAGNRRSRPYSSMNSSNSTNSTRPYSTLNFTRLRLSDSSRMMSTLSVLRTASTRVILDSDNNIVSTIRAISAASKYLSKPKQFTSQNTGNDGILTDSIRSGSVMPNPAEPTVELQVHFSTFIHLYLRKDAEKDVLATIRATWSQIFHLSGGDKGKLIKGQEMIKLDSLKGAVRKDTFERMCDNNEKPERRTTV